MKPLLCAVVVLITSLGVFAQPAHEAWNPYEDPAEFILLMFGEGA